MYQEERFIPILILFQMAKEAIKIMENGHLSKEAYLDILMN